MELTDYAVVLFLSICGVVIIGTVLKAALKNSFEDEQKPSRPSSHETRTPQNHSPAPRPAPTQPTQPSPSKPAKRLSPARTVPALSLWQSSAASGTGTPHGSPLCLVQQVHPPGQHCQAQSQAAPHAFSRLPQAQVAPLSAMPQRRTLEEPAETPGPHPRVRFHHLQRQAPFPDGD